MHKNPILGGVHVRPAHVFVFVFFLSTPVHILNDLENAACKHKSLRWFWWRNTAFDGGDVFVTFSHETAKTT